MSVRHPPDWGLFAKCGRCQAVAERPCLRLDGGGEAKRQHPGRLLTDGTQRRPGRPILTSGGRRATPVWSLRTSEHLAAAARAEIKRVRSTAAAGSAATGRCPWEPERGGWQCTGDRGHGGDHGYVREHLPKGVR